MSLPVCAACGVLAPDDRALCTLCASPFEDPRPEAPEPEGERRWVCVRTRFQCKACAQVSPVRGFRDDDVLTCQHCGQAQGFPDDELRDVLEVAHAAVDPGLRDFEVFDQLGGKATFIDYARDRISILAAPGHPRCGRCHTFVRLGRADGSTCEVTCECGPQAHRVPRVLGSRLPELRGVFSDETRTDVPRGESASETGATAFRCAQCGGVFDAGGIGHSPIVNCTYCKAANRIDLPLGPKADPVWLLVEGASKKRREHAERESRREARPTQPLEALVREVLAPAENENPVMARAELVPVAVFVGSILVVCAPVLWIELSAYLDYRGRTAMVQTSCAIERLVDEKRGDEIRRTYFGKAIDPRTGRSVDVVGNAHIIWAMGAGKSSTEEVIGTVGLPVKVPCFLDAAHDRVVFNRPSKFSVVPLFLVALAFLASLAGSTVLAKKALRLSRR